MLLGFHNLLRYRIVMTLDDKIEAKQHVITNSHAGSKRMALDMTEGQSQASASVELNYFTID